ncbi:MAG: type II secretion system F family protein [Patescibacteria group bacterium]
MPTEETKINLPAPSAKPALTAESNATGLENITFQNLEKKFIAPEGINAKFDLWLDHLRSVPVEEKIFFTQNLGVMFKSGLSASRALRTLTLQSTNPKFKRVLFKIYRHVEKGLSLAEAMRPYPKIFSNIFVSMIKAGEISGQLENVLTELTRQMKRSHELNQKVKGALMYPMAILIAMVGIGIAMLTFVVPKLLAIFKEMKVELPLPTRILIGVSDAVNEHILILGPIIAAVVAGLIYTRRLPAGKKFWHYLILKTPIVKRIAVKINLAKIARTLGSLLATDMPIVDSLKLTSEVVNNVYYRRSLVLLSASVEKGKTISSELPNFAKLYPPVVEQMIAIGEESGEISKILLQLADFY